MYIWRIVSCALLLQPHRLESSCRPMEKTGDLHELEKHQCETTNHLFTLSSLQQSHDSHHVYQTKEYQKEIWIMRSCCFKNPLISDWPDLRLPSASTSLCPTWPAHHRPLRPILTNSSSIDLPRMIITCKDVAGATSKAQTLSNNLLSIVEPALICQPMSSLRWEWIPKAPSKVRGATLRKQHHFAPGSWSSLEFLSNGKIKTSTNKYLRLINLRQSWYDCKVF